MKLIATLDRVPEKYFRHITNSSGIFEIRVEVQSNIFRAFSFFRQGKIGSSGEWILKEIAENTKERN